VNAVYPVVLERLRHPKETVRKKAVMALQWFSSLDPRREGPLMGVELERHFRTMLCDKVRAWPVPWLPVHRYPPSPSLVSRAAWLTRLSRRCSRVEQGHG
jgi:AP-4 complex subunit epsilon-1